MDHKVEIPRGDAAGFVRYLRHDLLAGFLVFLIALPLCLAIATASGFPPIAGLFTAIVGSIVTTFISNSELTIKGPAAGLIVIVLGCIAEFGGDGMIDGTFSQADEVAYRATLAVAVAAAVCQVIFAIFRAGILGEFFPVSAVHGMLAAIGIIIISKQVPVALGVRATGEPLELLANIPSFIIEANPAIAAIGIVSIAIMFLWPVLCQRVTLLKPIPAPMVALVATVPMGMAFDLLHAHSYILNQHEYQLSDQYLVKMPEHVFGMFNDVTTPDFSVLARPVAWKWVLMFFLIGSLESLLSAKAIDLLDPWKRKTNLDRDVLAVGVANFASACVGGLPMISEIVRSRANIDNGARTRFAAMWHGGFILVCVALIPSVLHLIPNAALAGMLVYTGFRLAHPKEFLHIYHIGREQLVVFVATIVGVLATDLLIGIAIGIGVKFVIHMLYGVPISSLFRPMLEVDRRDELTSVIRVRRSAVFSNWIPFRRQIEELGYTQRQNVVLDLADTTFIDHSVMDKLHEMQRDFQQQGLSLTMEGLEQHKPLTSHERSALRKQPNWIRRITVFAEKSMQLQLEQKFAELGATTIHATPCTVAANGFRTNGQSTNPQMIRIEVLATAVPGEAIRTYLQRELPPNRGITACIETIEVLRIPDAEYPQTLQDHVIGSQ